MLGQIFNFYLVLRTSMYLLYLTYTVCKALRGCKRNYVIVIYAYNYLSASICFSICRVASLSIITCLRVSVSPSAGWPGSDLPRTVLLHTDNMGYLLHFSFWILGNQNHRIRNFVRDRVCEFTWVLKASLQ